MKNGKIAKPSTEPAPDFVRSRLFAKELRIVDLLMGKLDGLDETIKKLDNHRFNRLIVNFLLTKSKNSARNAAVIFHIKILDWAGFNSFGLAGSSTLCIN